jgi:ankyrin repeat protein
MKAKVFYTALNDISWENGPEEVIRFARSHKKSLAAKSEDGKNLIQVLMYLDEDKADVDKAIVDIIEFMSRDAINLAGDDHETAVHTAVRLGRTKVYRKLLERHADVSVKDRKRRVVLHEAAYAGNVDAIERLLSEDESLTRAQDHEGLTPLDMACWQGKVDAARLLAERDPQPLNMTDSEDRSPLFTAVEHGHEEIVRELARYKPILDKGDKDGQKPLDWACLENKLNLATILLDAEADVNCLDHDGYTPLITACAQGHLDIVKLLLARNANVKIQAFDGDSVLVRASRFGHVEVIDHLIAREDGKELIDVRNDKGETPLLIACRFGFGPTASSLLKAGADRMQPSHEGWAPILEACKWRYTSIVHMLLLSKEHGVTDDIRMALLEQRNEKGSNFTALHYACYYGHVEVARLLLRNDASADITDSKGRTPLHNASRQGYLEVVELVCEQTSDLNVVDELGWNALHHASWDKFNDEDQLRHDELGHDVLLDDPGSDSVPGKHAEIIQLLIRKGVKPWTTTDKGKTALHLAAKRGHFSRISHILGAVNRMSDLHMRDSKGKTALGSAMQHQRSQVVFQLLYWMETADFGEMQDKQELMLWLANREETHDLVSLALKKDVDNVFSPPAGANTDKWTALEWAACRGYPKLLWRLLFSTQPSPERDRRIKDAERIATEFAARRKDKGGEPGHQQRTYNKHGRNEKNLDNSATVGAAMARLDHFKILNVLRNPPMTQTAGQKQQLNQLHDKPTYSPNSLDLISTYTAELVDFYSFENQSGFLRRCASVKDVIYVRGPAQIMGEARERTHKLDALYGPDNGLAVSEWDEDDVDVRWIHLPANNVRLSLTTYAYLLLTA